MGKFSHRQRAVSAEFEHTEFNTNRALLQLIADCLSSSDAHCDKNKDPAKLVDCVPERASDPDVCRQLQRIHFVDKKSITPRNRAITRLEFSSALSGLCLISVRLLLIPN
ncbi:MAG TPA: hypothetical protein VE954_27040 [Oligoflexus sp.]|uniref:hypothetical protein n=1 Tax=Oligoflexus sp. TaxID=1971216 RepID=UPI002D703219|nr:hypothetical protein [Oligoflexus sp.]HYX36780.1 hypothetical protein [Oligoflexus sp.]